MIKFYVLANSEQDAKENLGLFLESETIEQAKERNPLNSKIIEVTFREVTKYE